jgi:predicted RNA-binding protein YlxR (DUF448 family)
MREKDESRRGVKGEKPSRTCVGCHARIEGAPREGSFRVVLVPAGEELSRRAPRGSPRPHSLPAGEEDRGGVEVAGGRAHEIAVDLAGGAFGRGAHVHATEGCVAKACAVGFSKAFRCRVAADPEKLSEDVARAASGRIEGLLLGARRAGLLAFGEEAKGSSAHETPLFIVACDAGPSALGGPLRQAVADGRVLPFGTKESLGKLFSRELVALVAVRHESVAQEIRKANSLVASLSASGRREQMRSNGCRSREVR